jgi:hypothetical protein
MPFPVPYLSLAVFFLDRWTTSQEQKNIIEQNKIIREENKWRINPEKEWVPLCIWATSGEILELTEKHPDLTADEVTMGIILLFNKHHGKTIPLNPHNTFEHNLTKITHAWIAAGRP